MFASARLVQPVAQQQYLVGQMFYILKVIERMAICVQAPNIHSLNALLPLAIPTTYYLFYCGGRSSHRLLLKERACLTEIRQAHLLYSQRLIGVVVVANLALPSQARKW